MMYLFLFLMLVILVESIIIMIQRKGIKTLSREIDIYSEKVSSLLKEDEAKTVYIRHTEQLLKEMDDEDIKNHTIASDLIADFNRLQDKFQLRIPRD